MEIKMIIRVVLVIAGDILAVSTLAGIAIIGLSTIFGWLTYQFDCPEADDIITGICMALTLMGFGALLFWVFG